MFSIIKDLPEEDSIQIIYHLITLLNKGKNDPDDNIEFANVTLNLNRKQNAILELLMDEMDFDNIENDSVIDKYIIKLYRILEDITISQRNLDLDRGRERLKKLSLFKKL